MSLALAIPPCRDVPRLPSRAGPLGTILGHDLIVHEVMVSSWARLPVGPAGRATLSADQIAVTAASRRVMIFAPSSRQAAIVISARRCGMLSTVAGSIVRGRDQIGAGGLTGTAAPPTFQQASRSTDPPARGLRRTRRTTDKSVMADKERQERRSGSSSKAGSFSVALGEGAGGEHYRGGCAAAFTRSRRV